MGSKNIRGIRTKLLRNNEVRVVILLLSFLFIAVSIISTIMLNWWFGNINKSYIKQNTALIGAILEKNPELEEEIIPIILKGEIDTSFEAGREIVNKYYYDEGMNPKQNPIIKNEYINFKTIWIAFLVIVWCIVVLINIYAISPIFKKIKLLSILADNMVEGNFNNNILILNEGELSIFYNKFMEMGNRLQSAIEELKDEKVNLKNIINDISHQLKTPLSALITYNDILKNHNNMDREAKDKFIYMTSEQLDRMDWLITMLLKYARVESNAINYNKYLLSLKDTINYCMQPLKVKVEEKNQKIKFDFKGEGSYFHDEKWIGEALSNIIKNAIEHTPEEGEINICLEETPLSVTITINDNGEGIDKKDLVNVFKRFYKGKNSINPKSIGIGLSLSKKIIEAHEGNIVVESKLGEGATFYITFLK